jgi:hypothetical protein
MSIYQAHLPQAFPFVVEVPKADIDVWTTFLNTAEPRSSYAVTSDNYSEGGYVYLWLSAVSAERIRKTGFQIPDSPEEPS